MNILDYIPKGHENAVSRDYLRSVLHIPDREIRLMIANAEEQIFHYNGYFRHKNKSDRPYEEDYLRRELSRLDSQVEKVTAIKAAIYG